MSTENVTMTPDVGLAQVGGSHNDMVVAPSVTTRNVVSGETTTGHRGPPVTNADIFRRDVDILTVNITAGDTGLLDIFGSFDPWQAYLEDDLVASRLTAVHGLTNDLVLTIVMTVPGSCFGAYLISATCQGGNDGDNASYILDDNNDSYFNATQDVHAFLNCEFNNTIKLTLPFVDSKDYHVLSSPYSQAPMWTLSCWAVSPLQSSINSTVQGTIKVYAQMAPGDKMVGLQFQGKKSAKYPGKGKKYSEYGKMMASGLVSLSAVPEIAPFALPAAAGLAAFSEVADLFGYTREADPKPPEPTVARLFSNLSCVDGFDTSSVVGLYERVATTIDPRVGGGDGDDPTTFQDLFQRWTIVDVFNVNTSSTGIVRQLGVTPFLAGRLLGATYLQPGGFVGLPFSYWRGGMEFLVYIPSSSNLEGKLQILWDPRGDSPASYATDPTHRLSNVI